MFQSVFTEIEMRENKYIFALQECKCKISLKYRKSELHYSTYICSIVFNMKINFVYKDLDVWGEKKKRATKNFSGVIFVAFN